LLSGLSGQESDRLHMKTSEKNGGKKEMMHYVFTLKNGQVLGETTEIPAMIENLEPLKRIELSETVTVIVYDFTGTYYDENSETVMTPEEIRKSYEELKRAGDTESETFSDYLRNATDKNGSLTENPVSIVASEIARIQDDETAEMLEG